MMRRSRSPMNRKFNSYRGGRGGGSFNEKRGARRNRWERERYSEEDRQRVSERNERERRSIDKQREKKNEKDRKCHRKPQGKANSSNSPISEKEESYLEDIDGKSLIEDEGAYSYTDPSSSKFYQTFNPVTTTEVATATETSSEIRVVESTSAKEDSIGRLQRLEKLVEQLLTVKTQQQAEKPSTIVKGDIPELIPRNHNFTTSMWINSIHELSVERDFDESTTIQFMQSKMSGIIKTWFKTVSSFDFTWPELKLLITKTFPDNNDFAATLKLLVNREKQPDETVTQYFFSKMYLLEACKISGPNAVSCLIHSLNNPFMKEEAKSLNFLSPEALYSEYLSKFPDYEKPKKPEINEREVIQYEDHDDYEQEDVLVLSGDKERHRPVSIVRCYTCKKFGHVTAQCRYVSCYVCNKKGHIASECRYNSDFNDEILLCQSADESYQANFINCEINGQTLKGYIDSGSTMITIRSSNSKKLNLKCRPSARIIQGYGGGWTKALAESEVSMKIDMVQQCSLPVVIVADEVQVVPVIIGQPLLHHNNVVTILQNKKIRLFDKSQISIPDLPKMTFEFGESSAVDDWPRVIPGHLLGA